MIEVLNFFFCRWLEVQTRQENSFQQVKEKKRITGQHYKVRILSVRQLHLEYKNCGAKCPYLCLLTYSKIWVKTYCFIRRSSYLTCSFTTMSLVLVHSVTEMGMRTQNTFSCAWKISPDFFKSHLEKNQNKHYKKPHKHQGVV